jgi:hypothetical protein
MKIQVHDGHLGFQDGRQRYKLGIAPIEFIDIANGGLDTKIMII